MYQRQKVVHEQSADSLLANEMLMKVLYMRYVALSVIPILFAFLALCCVCLIAQSCLTLCSPMDCSPPGSSVHGDCPDKNTGVGCHTLLQGIFPTQGSNPGPPHIRKLIIRMPWPCSNKDSTLVNSSPILQVVSGSGLVPAIGVRRGPDSLPSHSSVSH